MKLSFKKTRKKSKQGRKDGLKALDLRNDDSNDAKFILESRIQNIIEGKLFLLVLVQKCLFPSSEMKNPEDFFSISARSVSKGGTLLPRVGFTAPSEARAVIETQGSKNQQNPARGHTSV